MSFILPTNCFISHSYKDISTKKLLIEHLPKTVVPFTFPPINVAPDEMVSNALIEAILQQDALIYFEGGHSAQSFWVAFERDYALRAQKPVFSFNPTTLEIQPTTTNPLDLYVFASYSRNDRDIVFNLLDVMREKRYFNIWTYNNQFIVRDNTPHKQTRTNIVERMNRGGYAVFFWSKNASVSKHIPKELEFVLEYNRYFSFDNSKPDSGRLLFVLLDDTPLPSIVQYKQDINAQFGIKPVQLYGDAMANRLDDLIVRLYWLIYRNTQTNKLD